MAALTYVYPYGTLRGEDDDVIGDLAARGARSVTELYSESLACLRLDNPVSELRLFFRHDPDLDDVRATVQVDPVREGFETGHLSVPTAFAERTPEVRALTLLEAVHGIVGRLGEARGWDPAALEGCRRHVLDQGLEYRWTSQPKSSPDRRHEARAVFRLAPDGYGRVSLQVARRRDHTVVASSSEGVAFGTSPGFRRAAKSLRWLDRNEVSLVPYDYVPAVRGGRVSLQHVGDAWVDEVEDYTDVRPVPSGDPALPALEVHVEGRGSTAPEQPPSVRFVGGGPIQSARIERFHDAFTAEMTRFCSAAGHDWWRPAGIRVLDVQITYEAERSQVRSRRSEQTLRIFVDRTDASLPSGDPALAARAAVEEVVALVRRRTGLGPHPGY